MSGRGKNKAKEGVVLLIDVGEAVGHLDDEGKSFLEKSKKCASRIIQRKIFSGAIDEYCLILIGSEDTKNDLDYPNIYVKNQYFCCPNWNMLKEVDSLSINSDASVNSDWLDGLIVAVNLLKDESECKKFSKEKIILMSNFANSIRSNNQIDHVISTMKDLKINLVVIGPETEDENSENEQKSNTQRKGEALISRIVEETDGVICGFDEAMSELGRYQKVTSRAAPWYCDLQIGSDIFIPVVGYKKFDSKKSLVWKTKSVDGSAITQEQVYFEKEQEVDKSDVINSYPFGQNLVPFSDADKAAVALPTEKCFQVIGFTKKRNVPLHIFVGDTVFYITPRSGYDGARQAISALAKVLLDQQMVAIVRRVYSKNSAPRLGALVPTSEARNPSCYFFYWVQLPFAEDERRLRLPSLRKEIPTQEQLEAVDNLIDSMDLSQLDEDEDPYRQPVNPAIEHRNDLITLKVLNPSSELPTEPSENVQNLLKPLPELLENAAEALDNIRRLFTLELVVQKDHRRKAADVFNRTMNGQPSGDVTPENDIGPVANFIQSTVTEVGTVDPEGNFLKLLEQGEPFDILCEQMQTAIQKLILASSSSVGIQKATSAQKLLRKHCVSKNPAAYNMFVSSLKDDLGQRGNTDLWSTITQERLGLITSEESPQSNVSADEAEVFYEMKKLESQEEVQYEMEAEDLLDEL